MVPLPRLQHTDSVDDSATNVAHQEKIDLPAQKHKNELFIPCCSPYLALSSGACGTSICASVPEL